MAGWGRGVTGVTCDRGSKRPVMRSRPVRQDATHVDKRHAAGNALNWIDHDR